MSYKAAVAGLDFGGGKAVIVGDPASKTEEVLVDYAGFVDSFQGRYLTAEDVGTTQADMDLIGRHTRFATGRSTALGGSGDPSPITAYGVVRAMEATAQALWGSDSLEGRRVAINGVGKVGRTLARLCADRGARVTVAGVSAAAVKDVRSDRTVEVSDPESIHRVACDIYAPCALGGALSDVTVPQLACEAVCGAANNQLESPEVETTLRDRGITYVPDYVANAGGIINIAYEFVEHDADAPRAHVGRIYDTVIQLFQESARSGKPLSAVADRLAEARIAAATAGSSKGA